MSKMAKRSTTAGLLLMGLMAATGCAREQESLIVRGAAAWTDGECIVDGANDVSMGRGTLDVAFGSPYIMPVILQNQLLTQPAMTSNNGIDNGEMQLIGADVTLRMPQAPDVLEDVAAQDAAFVEFSADLAAISIGAGERQGLSVEVVSQGASEAFADSIPVTLSAESEPTLLADVVFRARRTGNKVGAVGEVESRVFTYPIRLCLNCLFTCVGCVDGQCPVDDVGGFNGGICGAAQDRAVGPRVCADPNGDT